MPPYLVSWMLFGLRWVFMIETAMVFDRQGRVLHWHEPPGRSSGYIPDTRDLWDVIWVNRAQLGGVAHTHPWNGFPAPSETDLTTFDAVELALGQRLLWPIITFSAVGYFARSDVSNGFVRIPPEDVSCLLSVADIADIRRRSGG